MGGEIFLATVTNVVGIFPNDQAIFGLVGAIPLGRNDEQAARRTRYMALEAVAGISDDLAIELPYTVIRSA